MEVVLGLFSVVVAATIGGVLARSLRIPTLVGYILAGVICSVVLPANLRSVANLAEIGTILLLFSIGVELSFEKLSKFLKVAVFGAITQIIIVAVLGYFMLLSFGLGQTASLVLAIGFSLSSTAVVVKILSENGEMDTIHGGIMLGWLLVQDLAVIPIMVILPFLSSPGPGWFFPAATALSKALLIVITAVILGKIIIPRLVHQIARTDSRELLLLASISLALGTAAAASFMGISPSLGAFLAGVVISGSQEHHAIFAETRPLRDLFMALFFVTLGFLVSPGVILSNFPLIIIMSISILLLKAVAVFSISQIFGFKGKTAIANSFGLAQVGEFSFVILSVALSLKLIGQFETSLGIAVTLITLIAAPLMIKFVVPVWRKLKKMTAGYPSVSKMFSAGEAGLIQGAVFESHIIICGYGRVGKWVGKALKEDNIPFVVIEYNQKIVQELSDEGTPVVYGDPAEPEVLDAVNIRGAKAIILAIPDRGSQETLIAYVQTVAPDVKIISRAHLDEDWDKMKMFKVDKIIQPEFEAAVAIVRNVLAHKGKGKDEVSRIVKNLRMLHSK